MRYNSESLEIKVVISGNSLLFEDIKISYGLLITVRKYTLYCGKSVPLESGTQNSKQTLVVSDPIR